MDKTTKLLYLNQKFQILSLYVNTSASRNITPSYAYAWSEGVYPIFGEAAEWHQPYEECFEVRKKEIEELLDLLANRWDAKNYISFYGLEDHYGVRGSAHPGNTWDRHKLVAACRYMYLDGHRFDKEFWAALLKIPECPAEAHSVSHPFGPDEVYFM